MFPLIVVDMTRVTGIIISNLSGVKPHTVTYGYINCSMQVLPRVERDIPVL